MPRDDAGGRAVDGPRPAAAVGPVRGVYRPRRKEWLVGAVVLAVIAIGYALLRGGIGFAVHWFTSSWVPWVVVLAVPAFFALHSVTTVVSAGDGWLYVRELWSRRWVSLDELTEVTVRAGANPTLRLRDWQRRTVVTSIDNVRKDARIWSTVHAAATRALASGSCRGNKYAALYFGESSPPS